MRVVIIGDVLVTHWWNKLIYVQIGLLIETDASDRFCTEHLSDC